MARIANDTSSSTQISQSTLDVATQAIKVNIVASSGPGGLATEATLLLVEDAVDGLETTTSSIDGKTPALVSGRVPVDGSGVTQPVSATSLPLPTGASTSANQVTSNSSLSSIDGKTPALINGAVPVATARTIQGVVTHDSTVFSYGATSDVVLYKSGGTGGTTVSTLTINYTDTTKEFVLSTVRS
jgi:hypothetical protein